MRKENIKRMEESDEEKAEKKKVRTQRLFVCGGVGEYVSQSQVKGEYEGQRQIENRLLVMAVSYSRIHRRSKRCAGMEISL